MKKRRLLAWILCIAMVVTCQQVSATITIAEEREPDTTIETTSEIPTTEPTAEPTAEPAGSTVEPTLEQANESTLEPTEEPSAEPNEEPTVEPTVELSVEPTVEPSAEPAVEKSSDLAYLSGYAVATTPDAPVYTAKSADSDLIANLAKGDKIYVSDRFISGAEASESDWLFCHFEAFDGMKHGYIQAKFINFLTEEDTDVLIQYLKNKGNNTKYDGRLLPWVDYEVLSIVAESTPEPSSLQEGEPTPEPTVEPLPEPYPELVTEHTSDPTVEPAVEPESESSQMPDAEPVIESTPEPETVVLAAEPIEAPLTEESPAIEQDITFTPELSSEPELTEATPSPAMIILDSFTNLENQGQITVPSGTLQEEVTFPATIQGFSMGTAFDVPVTWIRVEDTTEWTDGAAYVFSPVLPVEYDIAYGIALPQITVIVSQPDSVSISIDPMVASPGDTVTLTAVVTGYTGATFQWQWAEIPGEKISEALDTIDETANKEELQQASEEISVSVWDASALTWTDEHGATGLTYQFVATDENLNRYWRLIITLLDQNRNSGYVQKQPDFIERCIMFLFAGANAETNSIVATAGYPSLMSTSSLATEYSGSDFTNNTLMVKRLDDLFALFPPEKSHFTVNNKECTLHGFYGAQAAHCTNCRLDKVVPARTTLGWSGGNGWTCFGFGSFAFRYLNGLNKYVSWNYHNGVNESEYKGIAYTKYKIGKPCNSDNKIVNPNETEISAKSIKNLLGYARTGDVIIGQSACNSAHVMIFLKKDDNYVYVYDNNRKSKSLVSIGKFTYSYFEKYKHTLALVGTKAGDIKDEPEEVITPIIPPVTPPDESVPLPTPQSIYLNQSSITIAVNQIVSSVTAYVTPTSADTSVEWESTDPSVADVDENGYIYGISQGNAVIRASTVNGLYVDCPVTIVKAGKGVIGISINKKNIAIDEGKSYKLSAKLSPRSPANRTITWSSSNPAIASVDGKGKVSGITPGSAVITAIASSGVSAQCIVTVNSLAVSQVVLKKGYLEVDEGKSASLKASVLPKNARSKTVIWSSSDPSIASVSPKGKIVTYKPGTVQIIATAHNGVSAACTLVVRSLAVSSILLKKTELFLKVRKSSTLKAYLLPKNTRYKIITWTSSNPSIVTVTPKGKIKAVSPGVAIISATAHNGLSATCTVHVE